MLFDIIQNNYACIIVSFLFIVFVITDKSFDSRIDAFFLIAILVPLLLTVIDNLELLEAQLAEPTFARRLYSALGYSLRPLSAIMMILIVGRDLRIKKSGKILSAVLAIPFFFNLIISFVSIFNGCVFNYNTNNHFFRGVFGLVPLFVSIFYVLCMVICSIVFLNTKRRSEILIIIVVAALCIIGSLMETNFQIDGSLNTACAIGTVFYYLYLHVSVYSTDQLTHVYNRRIFYLDIRRCKKKGFYIVSADVNNLKKTNDEHGHSAGDLLLTTFIDTLKKNLSHKSVIYRTGGDEFMIIFHSSDENEVATQMEQAEKAANARNVYFAYGICGYDSAAGIDEIVRRADEQMYIKKAEMKHRADAPDSAAR